MHERYFQPSLLWALVSGWIEDQVANRSIPQRPHMLGLYIYLTDREGAYYLRNGRIYWNGDLQDESRSNCDQDALRADRDVLGEVVVVGNGGRTTILLGRTFEEAVRRLAGEPVSTPADKVSAAV